MIKQSSFHSIRARQKTVNVKNVHDYSLIVRPETSHLIMRQLRPLIKKALLNLVELFLKNF